MLTHNGYYEQIDGLAMGSPVAPMLANGWMSKFDTTIKGDATLFSRYMDDVLRDIRNNEIENKLEQINNLHPSLKFTVERQINGSIPFLDMRITNLNGKLSSTWYTKRTDTGLTMNFHAVAPLRYKRSVVSGMIHRIIRACSNWSAVHESITKAKKILENNQFPPSFYEPIIKKCLNSVCDKDEKVVEEDSLDDKKEKLLFLQYRGKISDQFQNVLRRIEAPCKVIYTLQKIKTVMPSLKTPVEKSLKSGTVYQIKCSRCQSCYVGQSSRHLGNRIKEHARPGCAVGKHFKNCHQKVSMNDVNILASSSRSYQLLILEALFIKDIKPGINVKDEYRSMR